MKPRHLLIIAMVGILLVPYSSSDEFVKCTCTGKCQGRDVNQSATKLYEVFSISEEEECFQRAKKAFGGHCGSLAQCNSGCAEASKVPLNFDCGGDKRAGDKCGLANGCGENCGCDSDTDTCWPLAIPEASTCCKDWCSGFLADKPAYYGCIQSCEAGCRTNDLTNQFISVFQYIAVVIAAIMLAVNGIKLITSDSPYDRDQAKHSIRYILIALLILALVIYLANAIFAPIQVPGGETSMGKCT